MGNQTSSEDAKSRLRRLGGVWAHRHSAASAETFARLPWLQHVLDVPSTSEDVKDEISKRSGTLGNNVAHRLLLEYVFLGVLVFDVDFMSPSIVSSGGEKK